METLWGRRSLDLDSNGLKQRLANYTHTLIDLGTGDGRFVRCLAEKHKENFFIGIDACRENLRVNSQSKLPNTLFIIASAQSLPAELNGLASQVSINFPWGSLLGSLLNDDACLIDGLASVSKKNARIDISMNGGALTEAGSNLDTGSAIIHANMIRHGWDLKRPQLMDSSTLKAFPSTWARRLAHGRDPRAMTFSGKRVS